MISLEKIPEATCLSCGARANMAVGMFGDDSTPEPNQKTMCVQCGYPMAFDDNLQLRELTSEEMKEIAGSPELLGFGALRERLKEALKRASATTRRERTGAIRELFVVLVRNAKNGNERVAMGRDPGSRKLMPFLASELEPAKEMLVIAKGAINLSEKHTLRLVRFEWRELIEETEAGESK